MRFLCIAFVILFYSRNGNAQEEKLTSKPTQELFKSLEKYDTLNLYIINDETNLKFNYSDSYLGAVDENFNLELHRQIRFKINDLKSFSKEKFLICENSDSSLIANINFREINVYSLKNGKVIKKDYKIDPSSISFDQSRIMLDWENIEISEGSIVDIKYSVKELSKEKQFIKLNYPYYLIQAELLFSIPEIYAYDILENDPYHLIDKYHTEAKQGIFIGYYMPEVNLKYKLVTKAYYKILKDRGDDVSKAEKVYCKYVNHQFYLLNVTTNKLSIGSANIELNLKSISPILY